MNNAALQRMDALSRALIGFDTMFDQMERRYANSVNNNYPPHNILRLGDNEYAIQVAVTGFDKTEISVTVENNVLMVKGESMTTEYPQEAYLHRGLATRDFIKEFPLAEHIEVVGAETKNGMLIIKLIRNVPESAKPKVIDIVEVK
jgi:molecular chaperone IbpA